MLDRTPTKRVLSASDIMDYSPSFPREFLLDFKQGLREPTFGPFKKSNSSRSQLSTATSLAQQLVGFVQIKDTVVDACVFVTAS